VQRLFGVSMALSVEEDLSREQRHRCAQEIQDALVDLRTAVQRPLRRSPDQHPTTLLEEVRRLEHEHPELAVELLADPQLAVPAHLEPLAQSVLAEALRNALKHAEPTRVRVHVGLAEGALVLEVINDGVTNASRRTGMGLRLAAFEALEKGGVIEFGQADGDGWRVRLLVPVGEEAG
jgi:signal transduction histidine kinase